jgi:hypothetical protein
MVRLRDLAAQVFPVIPLTAGLAMLPIVVPLLLAPAAQAQSVSRNERILSVSGRGVESIPTSLAQITLGVEIQGKSAEQVQAEVARKSNAVVDLLKSYKVDKLQTRGIQLSPTYDYANNRQKLTGYTGTNSVSFQVAIAQAGDILDKAVQSGASRIDGISFTATDAAIATAQKAALKKATADAQAQAEAVLSALDFKPQEVVGIQVNNAVAPVPMMRQMAADIAAAPRPTPVVGGDQEVEGSVTLQIRY